MDRVSKIVELMPSNSTMREFLYHTKDRYGDYAVIKEIKHNQIEEKAFSRLLEDSERLGCKLAQMGIKRANAVLLGPASYNWLVAFFGIMNYSNRVVPVDYNLAYNDMASIIEKAQAAIIFYDEICEKQVKELLQKENAPAHAVCLQRLEEFTQTTALTASHEMFPGEDDIAMITFTSGTTGANKGVMLSHRNLFDNVICSVSIFGHDFIKAGDTTVCILPLYHMLGVTATIFFPLFYGCSLCLLGEERDMPAAFLMYQPAFLIMVPLIANGLIKYAKRRAAFLHKEDRLGQVLHDLFGNHIKFIVCGGASLEEHTIHAYTQAGIRLLNGYGITECSPVVSCNPYEKQKKGSVGKPVPKPYCEVTVKDGEIYIRGTIVTKGYYNDPESTNALFEQGWLKTGDLGYLDEEGYLYITGRKKDVIILSNGVNVSPQEIEKHFVKSPLIENILVDVKTDNHSEGLIAYIYPAEQARQEKGITEQLNSLTGSVNKKLPRYMQIQQIQLVDRPFEVTALGKIKRYKYKSSINEAGSAKHTAQ